MPRAYIIHRWDGSPEGDWYQWLRRELRDLGWQVDVPMMPNPAEPTIETWVDCLKNIIKNPGPDVFLIGHSIGAQTVLRYVEQLTAGTKLGGIMLVAPWLKLNNLETPEVEEIARPWLETPINFTKIKHHTTNIEAIFSDDDYFVPVENQKLFKKLTTKILVEGDKGHFSEEDEITALPCVLQQLIHMAKSAIKN